MLILWKLKLTLQSATEICPLSSTLRYRLQSRTYKVNRRAVSTQPWGALVWSSWEETVWPPIQTVWCLFVKKSNIQCESVVLNPDCWVFHSVSEFWVFSYWLQYDANPLEIKTSTLMSVTLHFTLLFTLPVFVITWTLNLRSKGSPCFFTTDIWTVVNFKVRLGKSCNLAAILATPSGSYFGQRQTEPYVKDLIKPSWKVCWLCPKILLKIHFSSGFTFNAHVHVRITVVTLLAAVQQCDWLIDFPVQL